MQQRVGRGDVSAENVSRFPAAAVTMGQILAAGADCRDVVGFDKPLPVRMLRNDVGNFVPAAQRRWGMVADLQIAVWI